ncbi:hypothetical protein CRG98_000968 [Punica granatum]|uniref:MULE transposase domain-containing protein n=1 Tax=Punica granatum TaxID=22663 RepID=A0A2I0LD42_PUNGR|nr:hypothetical protein CRG98_000968 [Punica granatum]
MDEDLYTLIFHHGEQDEDAWELESDSLDDGDSDDAWVPGQDGDEHDDCTKAGEGGGGAAVDKTVEEAWEKGGEGTNMAESSRVFKEVVKDYTVSIGREMIMNKNDKLKKFIPNHSCSRKLQNKQVDSKWIVEKLIYNALRITKKLVQGCEEKQYTRLRYYCGEIIASNPSSGAVIGVDRPNSSFPPIVDRIYICFDASKRVLLVGCRPLIGLDGCFLKGYYRGTLLVVVTQDPNHSFYVIAYGVVEHETKDSWS